MLSLIRTAVEDDHLLFKYWDLHSVNSPNKNSLSLMRSNLIGHTIFLPGEKYRTTNQKPDTIFVTSEKIRIGFSRLSGRSCEVNVRNVPCFTRIMASRFADINSVEQFFEDHWRKRKYKKENSTECALLKEFLTLRNEKKLPRRSWMHR